MPVLLVHTGQHGRDSYPCEPGKGGGGGGGGEGKGRHPSPLFDVGGGEGPSLPGMPEQKFLLLWSVPASGQGFFQARKVYVG